ncbi:MAG: Gfo/Idh/MocA family oxidoreductase [Alphaproteobacteria bacterium]
MLSAAVVGLGQAGSRFDEEPRPVIWSHAGAYLAAADRYRLAGGADISAENRQCFIARCPEVTVFADGADMAAELKPDVISICTPPAGRADLVERILAAHRPKALICEKPLELDSERRCRLTEACKRSGVPLLVNYNRRYATIYRKTREAIVGGLLGKVTAITVSAPNRLWSVGSHAVNLLLYLAGETPERWKALHLPGLDEGGEPAYDLLCRFSSGAAGRVLTTGFREMAMFEADVIGRDARIQVRARGTIATLTPFEASAQYLNYRVLGDEEVLHRTDETESTFEILVNEAADVAEGRARPSSTGEDALLSEEFLTAITAKRGTGEGNI